jgi:SAM-dependent methyltransferase
LPLPDRSVEVVVMFLTFHHLRDQAAALREVGRVLADDGVLLLRGNFADRLPGLYWYRCFPSAVGVERAMYPELSRVRGWLAGAGLVEVALGSVVSDVEATMSGMLARLRQRALSTFEHVPEDEIVAGLAAMERDVAAGGDRPVPSRRGDLLVAGRGGRAGAAA